MRLKSIIKYVLFVFVFFIAFSCSKPKTFSILGKWKLQSVVGGPSGISLGYANSGFIAEYQSNRTYNYSTFNNIIEKGVFSISPDQYVIRINNKKSWNIFIPDEEDLYLTEKDSLAPYSYHYKRYPRNLKYRLILYYY